MHIHLGSQGNNATWRYLEERQWNLYTEAVAGKALGPEEEALWERQRDYIPHCLHRGGTARVPCEEGKQEVVTVGTGCSKRSESSHSLRMSTVSSSKGETKSSSSHSAAALEVLCCYRFQKVSFNEPDISLTQNNPFKRKVRNNCCFLFFSPLLYCYNDFA